MRSCAWRTSPGSEGCKDQLGIWMLVGHWMEKDVRVKLSCKTVSTGGTSSAIIIPCSFIERFINPGFNECIMAYRSRNLPHMIYRISLTLPDFIGNMIRYSHRPMNKEEIETLNRNTEELVKLSLQYQNAGSTRAKKIESFI